MVIYGSILLIRFILLTASVLRCYGGYKVTIVTDHPSGLHARISDKKIFLRLAGHKGHSKKVKMLSGRVNKASMPTFLIKKDYGVIHHVTVENESQKDKIKISELRIHNDVTGTTRIEQCDDRKRVCLLDASRISIEFFLTVNGKWAWSSWSSCSSSCAGGVRTRKAESCRDPPPRNNGTYCQGPRTESSPCNEFLCQGQASSGVFPTGSQFSNLQPKLMLDNQKGEKFHAVAADTGNRDYALLDELLAAQPKETLSACRTLLKSSQSFKPENTSSFKTPTNVSSVIPPARHQPAEAFAAAGIGGVAILVIISVLTGIVLLDISNIVSQATLFKRNITRLYKNLRTCKLRGAGLPESANTAAAVH